MILIEATIKYKGYSPLDLKPKSNKRVCCSCDKCGRVRWVEFKQYRDLCMSCIQIGKTHNGLKGLNNPMYDVHLYGKDNSNYNLQIDQFIKKHTGKHFCKCGCDREIKILRTHYNIGIPEFIKGHHVKGASNPNWKGGLPRRIHLKHERDCIKLNSRFKNSEFHHLTKSIGVFIFLKIYIIIFGIVLNQDKEWMK